MRSGLALTFHRIGVATISSGETPSLTTKHYTVSPDRFEKVMTSISPDNCCTAAEFVSKSGADWLILTFDDGYLSDYEIVLPTLSKRKIQGTFFVTTAKLGTSGYVAVPHLREMTDAGMEIGSHGLTHRYLTEMDRSEAIREIRESKDRLEQQIGVEVTSFAPVGGHYRGWMVEAAYHYGYRAFASMIPGRTSGGNDTLILKRNHIQAHHGEVYMSRLLKGDVRTLFLNRILYHILRLPKTILGMHNYDRAKDVLLKYMPTVSKGF